MDPLGAVGCSALQVPIGELFLRVNGSCSITSHRLIVSFRKSVIWAARVALVVVVLPTSSPAKSEMRSCM